MLMKWLNQNWKGLLVITSLPILVMGSIRLWFWIDVNLHWTLRDSTLFSNVATPISAIVSGTGILITLVFLYRQNRVILSQGLRPHIEREITAVSQSLAQDLRLPAYKGSMKEFNIINCYSIIFASLFSISTKVDFINDLKDYKKKRAFTCNDIENRDYFSEANFLNITFIYNGMEQLSSIRELMETINKSDLLPQEIRFYKNQIKRDFVVPYVLFIDTLKVSDFVWIPILFESDPIRFIKFQDSNFARHYDYFKKEFYS
jgi:hypothetical protein